MRRESPFSPPGVCTLTASPPPSLSPSHSSLQVRASLKEPLKTKAKTREAIYYRTAQWAEGAPRQAEVVDLVDPEVEAAAKAGKK